jgi:hypothetical protein
MKITIPTGQFIGPGFQQIHTVRQETEEVWFMGHLIETKIHEVHEVHGVNVPDPGLDGPEEDENSWPVRGEFTFADRTFTVVRDDDIGFWGFLGGEPLTRRQFILCLQMKSDRFLTQGVIAGWWSLDPVTMTPVRKAQSISIAEMAKENKTLMAHLMVDLGFFPSVGQARKNGWDKPLEPGRHELGPKKKRIIVEIVP